jgi:hypothetical protein
MKPIPLILIAAIVAVPLIVSAYYVGKNAGIEDLCETLRDADSRLSKMECHKR